ncbi:hypothetical protein FRC08_000381, partial [Ceratobasidium sp. 394]
MTRRYTLCPPGLSYQEVNWLEQFETWKQRTRRSVVWDIQRTNGQYAARVEIDGTVPNVVGIGRSSRDAKINLVIQLENSEPAIL